MPRPISHIMILILFINQMHMKQINEDDAL